MKRTGHDKETVQNRHDSNYNNLLHEIHAVHNVSVLNNSIQDILSENKIYHLQSSEYFYISCISIT